MPLLIQLVDSAYLLENTEAITKLLDDAYEGDFSEQDWLHTFGGDRFLGVIDNEVVAHAAVVPREILINEMPTTVGYLEGVAVSSTHQGQGIGSHLLQKISEFCESKYVLSMLSTDEFDFYGKFGWQRFKGISGVIENGFISLTPDEDDGLMYLAGHSTNSIEILTAYCDWREGDYW